MSFSEFFVHRLPSVLRQVRNIKKKRPVKYYAVAVGKRRGIYVGWPSAVVQITNIANAKFSRFDTKEEAMEYMEKFPYQPPVVKQNVYKPVAEMRQATVFIDGSCYNNGYPDAKAAIGVYWPGMPEMCVSETIEGKQTSARAELLSAIKALEQAAEMGVECLTICCDSHYVIHSATRWLYHWRKNGFKTSSGEDVKNKADLMELERAMYLIPKVIWKPVVGHSGNRGNDEADVLASSALMNLFTKSKQKQIEALKEKLRKARAETKDKDGIEGLRLKFEDFIRDPESGKLIDIDEIKPWALDDTVDSDTSKGAESKEIVEEKKKIEKKKKN